MIISQLNINKSYLVLYDIVYWCAVFRVGFHLATCSYPFIWFQVYILVFVYINVVSTVCKIKVREATITLLLSSEEIER